ncbi:MAG: NADH-quinone oxidoreductase subunit J [Elusimicrobia bacterium]|nr:MAG: NADH-quinone oxidoreductase subunit J [Elusimicrobiota bacterium]
MEHIVFYSLSSVALISALGVVLMRNVLHCALMLGLSLMAVAGLFGSLGADFLFAGQIVVYVTGVAVLVLFVVMLAGRESELNSPQTNDKWPLALVIGAITFGGFWRFFGAYADTYATTDAEPTTRGIGILLLSDYALPFELISLILIAALIGAIHFSRVEESQ